MNTADKTPQDVSLLNAKRQIFGYDAENDLLYIDGSSLRDWMTCKRRYLIAHYLKRISSADKPALVFGKALHYVQELQHSNQICSYVEVARQFGILQTNDHRNISMLETLCEKARKRWSPDLPTFKRSDGTPVLEGGFMFPLTDHIIWCGRIDRVVLLQDGSPAILDYKTSSYDSKAFWNAFDFDISQIGYVWALSQALDQLVDRFVIRAFFTRAATPDVDQRDFIIDHRRIEEWRRIVTMQAHDIFTWLKSLRLDIAEKGTDVIKDSVLGFEHFANWSACYAHKFGPCPFFHVCNKPDLFGRKALLAGGLFTDNTWSPLDENE